MQLLLTKFQFHQMIPSMKPGRAKKDDINGSHKIKRVCVFCGSTFGASAQYSKLAASVGSACAKRGFGIVYGGGSVGLMGIVAESALVAGGEVIGVIPKWMISEERAHKGLTQLISVDTMHERKAKMAELSDAFIALPGGIGTLEEIIEAFSWLQLAIHLKPVGLLNSGGFYDSLIAFLDHLKNERFLSPEHRAMLTIANNIDGLLDQIVTLRHVPKSKLIAHTRD